uniref:hypothetical protein n=1 Tax=Roseivirga sp. TaxID=1964215 RepID=UPI004048B90B
MSRLLTYNSFEDKKALYEKIPLSKEEALVRALDPLDFQAAISSQNPHLPKNHSSIDWIELQYLKNDK